MSAEAYYSRNINTPPDLSVAQTGILETTEQGTNGHNGHINGVVQEPPMTVLDTSITQPQPPEYKDGRMKRWLKTAAEKAGWYSLSYGLGYGGTQLVDAAHKANISEATLVGTS